TGATKPKKLNGFANRWWGDESAQRSKTMAVIKVILPLNENHEITSNEAFANFISICACGARVVKERHDIAKHAIIYKIDTTFLDREKYREEKKRPAGDGPPMFRIAPGYETAVRDIHFGLTDAGIEAAKAAIRHGPLALEILEYTARKVRECDEDFPTRTYKKHDLVFDLETQTVCRIAKIIMGGM